MLFGTGINSKQIFGLFQQVLSLEINIGILTLILILVTNTLSYSELIEYQVDL